jgi:hypothetical protein
MEGENNITKRTYNKKIIKEKKNTQVFNKEVSLKCLYDTLYDILQKICIESEKTNNNNENEYLLTKAVFKRAELLNYIQPFIETIKPYYYFSKQHYVHKLINYNAFITIIRQLCNVNDIKYTSKIVYIKSNYEIQYTIVLANASALEEPFANPELPRSQ